MVEKTTVLAEERKKKTMDSIYTTNKGYADGTTLVEIKPYHLETVQQSCRW
jgi:hypothetical protein